MLDLQNRATLMGSLPKGGIGVEIGTAAGDFAATILDVNQPSRLYLVDCWDCLPHESPEPEITNADLERQYHQVMRRFIKYPRVYVHRARSLVAASFFPDGFLDWIYIDASHIDVARDIAAWEQKVKIGGWFTGHDYINEADGTINRVQQDVDEYVARHNHTLFVTEDDSELNSWAFRRLR